jgi:hypothetical protein
VVVVDVHRERRGGDERGLHDSARLGAVDRKEHPLRGVLGRGPTQTALRELQERVLAGQSGVASEHHHGVLPERAEREMQREERADRVAVGVVVRGDDETVVRAHGLDDGVHVTPSHRRLRRAARARR